MPAEPVTRRLAAILAADISGYSRLMEADEEATLARLKALRREVIDPAIADHRGRLVKLTGDGALVEFASAVDAVRCAVATQEAVSAHQRGEPPERRIAFRIGVNLGDIIVDEGDVYGDGVNVAARLEGLAEPGGIVISANVHDEVVRRLQYRFDDLGEQQVKNIERPVRAWRVVPDAPEKEPETPAPRTAARGERPGIAVLPFANMSGDPEQEYFADGMVEEIITGLARIRWLTVIARNSTFAYKGQAPDIRKVGSDLAVRYVLEGSVRKAGEKVRITAQLVEAETGGHLWADRFDGWLADVFDLQDQITAGVVAAIEPSVRRAEIERARRERPDNLDAYDLYLRALEQAYKFTPDGRGAAIDFLDAALALDPAYSEAHGLAAFCRMQRFLWEGHAPSDREAALRHAEAVALARTEDASALAFAAIAIGALAGGYDSALTMLELALAANPSSAPAHYYAGLLDSRLGRYDSSLVHAERSFRLSPFDPQRHVSETLVAFTMFARGEYDACHSAVRRALAVNPDFVPVRIVEAACLVRLGRLDEAKDSVRRIVEVAPDTRLATLRERTLAMGDAEFDGMIADLRAAGMPE